MTTTTSLPTATGPRLLGTTSVAVLLVGAAVLDTLEQVVSPLTSSTTYADTIAISQHQTRFVVSVLIGVAATLLFLPGLLGLMARTVGRAPIASRIAAVLVCLGFPSFMGIRLGQAIELQGIRDNLPNRTTAHLVDHLNSNPIGVTIVVCFLLGTVLGVLVLGVAMWRAGLPRVAAVLVAAFGVVDMSTEGVVPGWLVHLMLVVGFGLTAMALVRPGAAASTPPGAAVVPVS
jgi:hypothetical protein